MKSGAPTPEEVRVYLQSLGWSLLESESRSGETWVLPGNESAPAILLPTHVEDRDFPSLMESALRRISFVTGAPREALAREVVVRGTDEVSLLIEDPTTEQGRIGLERGSKAVAALYEILQNGARVWSQGARPVFAGSRTEEIRDVLDHYQLAAPETGSFRLVVTSPAPMQLDIDTGVPLDRQRQAIAASLDAADAARDAAERASSLSDLDDLDDWVMRGLSANLLKALSGVDSQSSALSVELSVRWAGGQTPEAPSSVTFRPQHMARIRPIEGLLRQQEPKENFSLSGWIKTVTADEFAPSEPLSGTVIVEANIAGRTREVRLELDDQPLREARRGLGERGLTAHGTLEKIRNRWHLTGARDIVVK